MSLALLVYLIGFLPSLGIFVTVLFLSTFFGVFICLMVWGMSHGNYSGNPPTVILSRGWGIFWVVIGVFLMFVKSAIPSEKTAYLMVGAYATQKIYESPEVQKVQDKVMLILNKKLDEYIKEDKKEWK